MRRWLIWLPLVAFGVLLAVALNALVNGPDRPEGRAVIQSRMVGQPLPDFDLPPAAPGQPGLSSKRFTGGAPRLLNLFASWCVPCAIEAPQLARLKAAGVEIDAIAVRDKPADLAAFLDRHGNPFAAIGNDADGQMQLALGSSGVPETFVIDARGRIAHQHIGPIGDQDMAEIMAALEKAK